MRILGQRAAAPLLLPRRTCRIGGFEERAIVRVPAAGFSARGRGIVARVLEQFRYARVGTRVSDAHTATRTITNLEATGVSRARQRGMGRTDIRLRVEGNEVDMSDILIDRPELASLGAVRVRLGGFRRCGRLRAPRHLAAGGDRHLRAQERARLDAPAPPQGPPALRAQADAHLGRRPVGDRLRQHQVLRALHREAGPDLGRPARGHPEHLREARHPRGGAPAPRRRRRRPVRVRGRLPPDPRRPRGAGRHLPRHRHRARASTPRSSRSTSARSSRPATTSSPR